MNRNGGSKLAWIFLLAVGIWFVLFLRKKLMFKFGFAPNSLDLKQIKGLKKLGDALVRSLNESYMENVEERVKKEIKLKENEYKWRLLDLKRYFILTAFLKETPMFSVKVDELWHQMLMFTREYDDFSKKYLGTTLHHSPNVNLSPDPDLRGFFDWVYAELFFIRAENIYLYNGFFRSPVQPAIIEEFRNLSENELIEKYFKGDTQYTVPLLALVTSMKKTANSISDYEKNVIQDKLKKSKRQKNYNAMLMPALSVAYFHYDEFANYMKIDSERSTSSSSCGSASSCSSCTSDSSCSSCGGGGD